jgi:hypothetical protein
MSTDVLEDSWWVDYLENEMDPSLEKDLQLLLQNSQEDRDAFESYRLLREWLKASDPIGDWPLEARLKNIRQNVMEGISALPAPTDYLGTPPENPLSKSLRP